MKRLNLNKLTAIFLLFTFFAIRASSQCMMEPVPLDERINSSTAIVEGIVTGQRSTWDDMKKRIYTIYTIEVTSVFKGNVPATVEMAMPGGTVGDMTMTATSAFRLGKGSAGIFMLEASRQRITARSTVYDCYSAAQGFLRYDRSNKSASGVFDEYASVEKNLYPLLESKTGHARLVRKAFLWDKANAQEAQPGTLRGAAGANDLAHTLTSFSPTTTTAGTSSVLTITGSGFGSSQGSSYVQFRDADDDNAYMNASSYSSWSDTEIQVVVPSGAGTGKVKVVVGGTTKTSSGTLTINYNLDNSGTVFKKMIDDNGNGGYTFQMHTNFANSSSAKSIFLESVQDWICNVNVNWTVSGTSTTIDEVASDGVNVVRWDHDDLPSGTLGITYTYSSCNEAKEMDIVFNEDKPWYFNSGGNCPSDKFDFYSVVLHELGHACRQGHVIKDGDMMHYAISKGQDNEDFVQEITINGGLDAVNRSQSSWCSSGMTRMYCTQPTVTLSAGATSFSSESGSTTITATLSNVYYDTVTIQLSLSGTATLNTDYSIGATSLVIVPGKTSASTTLSCTSDVLDEDDETVIADISSVTNGTENGTQQKTVTIMDNDATPTVSFSMPQTSVTEGNGTYFDFTATLSAVSGRTVVIYFTHGGTATWNSDYTIFTPQITNMLVISPGELTGTTSFIYLNDTLYENSETAIIGIDSIDNATATGTQQYTVTINDNDAKPTVSLSASGTGFFETGITGVFITATLSKVSGAATTVNLGFSGTGIRNTDYTCNSSITIPAGSTSATIGINVIDDAIDEENETAIVDIISVTNATENGTQQRTFTITDDDAAPNVSIAWSKTSIGEAITGNSNAVATLSTVSGKEVTISLSFTGTATLNSDYTVTGSSITIPAGSTSGFVTMNNIPDTLNEGNEYVTVNMATVTNATKVNPQSATMTINDDDGGSTGRTAGAVVATEIKKEDMKQEAVKVNAVAGPNPFSTQVTVRNLETGSTMQLADANGVIISTVKVGNSTMTVNTSSLKAGIYFLRIISAGTQKQTIKLMKQ